MATFIFQFFVCLRQSDKGFLGFIIDPILFVESLLKVGAKAVSFGRFLLQNLWLQCIGRTSGRKNARHIWKAINFFQHFFEVFLSADLGAYDFQCLNVLFMFSVTLS